METHTHSLSGMLHLFLCSTSAVDTSSGSQILAHLPEILRTAIVFEEQEGKIDDCPSRLARNAA